jgi:hypothetical protein
MVPNGTIFFVLGLTVFYDELDLIGTNFVFAQSYDSSNLHLVADFPILTKRIDRETNAESSR